MNAFATRPVLSLLLGVAAAIVGAVIGHDPLFYLGAGLAGGGALSYTPTKK
jgi:hypothetical protein